MKYNKEQIKNRESFYVFFNLVIFWVIIIISMFAGFGSAVMFNNLKIGFFIGSYCAGLLCLLLSIIIKNQKKEIHGN